MKYDKYIFLGQNSLYSSDNSWNITNQAVYRKQGTLADEEDSV